MTFMSERASMVGALVGVVAMAAIATLAGQTEPAATEARIRQLEERVRQMEAELAKRREPVHRVVAPFSVVDASGRTLLDVTGESYTRLRLFNPSSQPVVFLSAHNEGGFFKGTDSSVTQEATVGVYSDLNGVRVKESGVIRMDAGKRPKGNYAAAFFAPAGGLTAGVGQSEEGGGLLSVGTAAGEARALVRIVSGTGTFTIQNRFGVPVAALTEGSSGGGLLNIGDATGEPMVQAGVAPGKYGIVRAGPASFTTAAGLGLPGSYILGKAQ